ncbi:MAG: MotA/TolQ/ExbB proton channel family protein [Chitinispirillia bacterium]|nr:MotA/TolQ/ExbB proton channel family protein [Chitinispirillia bacterium]MCL2241778.1 MotA/TolQ/ExbB proton channel family protein [Chitinispirillia bacterium]
MMLIKFVQEGFLTSGAWCMWMIMVLLALGMGFVIERVWYLYFTCGSGSGTFMNGVSKYVKAGEFDKAIKYAAAQKTPLAKGVVAILQNRGRGSKAVQKAVDEVFLTEAPKITRNIPFIPTIANITTLVGLMGTIYGLMLAFDAIANVPAAQRAQALAAGISMSMSSTLWALLVAVPLLLAHGLIAGKSDGVMQQLDEKATKLINMVEA